MAELVKVVVDRARWYRGRGEDFSRLLLTKDGDHPDASDNGKMCCLGFACIAMGIAKAEFANRATPRDLISYDCDGSRFVDPTKRLTKAQVDWLSKDFSELMSVNDNELWDGEEPQGETEYKTEAEREARIAELGKEVGLEFEFIG